MSFSKYETFILYNTSIHVKSEVYIDSSTIKGPKHDIIYLLYFLNTKN